MRNSRSEYMANLQLQESRAARLVQLRSSYATRRAPQSRSTINVTAVICCAIIGAALVLTSLFFH